MQPFRFFDLPRELRNLVYEHAVVHVHLQRDCPHGDFQLHLRNLLDANILCANRQMSDEYREQLADRTYLLIPVPRCESWLNVCCACLRLREVVGKAIVYVHVVCFCDFTTENHRAEFQGPCDGAEGLRSYFVDLKLGVLRGMPQLQSAHLNIALWCAPDAKYERRRQIRSSQEPPQLTHSLEFQKSLAEFAALPYMKSINIARFTNDAEYDQFCLSTAGKALPTIATWTPTNGWRSEWK